MADSKWKKFEADIQAHLKDLQKRRPLIYHRFYDTASAQVNFLPNQPGDFMTVCEGWVTLIEAKTSVKHDSLRSCAANAIAPAQLGMHKKWLRAGATCLFVFQGPDGVHEIWPSIHVVEQRSNGRPLHLDYCAHFASKTTFLEELTQCVTI